ncbi:MAG: hypothetical protein ABT940_13005, partial [Alphaproteobacteria bacterium]
TQTPTNTPTQTPTNTTTPTNTSTQTPTPFHPGPGHGLYRGQHRSGRDLERHRFVTRRRIAPVRDRDPDGRCHSGNRRLVHVLVPPSRDYQPCLRPHRFFIAGLRVRNLLKIDRTRTGRFVDQER